MQTGSPSTWHSLSLSLTPPPQDLEQGVHSLQEEKAGQFSSLHGTTSSLSPSHLESPFLSVIHSLVRFFFPPPQVSVQGVHSVQSVQSGQVSRLHFSVSSFSPVHNVSELPDFGRTHSRNFVLEPPPHVFVQGVQSVQSVQDGHSSELQTSFLRLSPSHTD